jgi:hypothetical protein
MTATITAVNADPGAGLLTPNSTTERTVQEFAAILQNSAMSGMPQLANPGALASELFGHLRGYFERAQNYERAFRIQQSHDAAGDDGVQFALLSVPDELRTPGLHRGPARENLEPSGADGDAPPAVRTSDAGLGRVADLLLQSAELANEEYLLATEVSQTARSLDTLFRGQ